MMALVAEVWVMRLGDLTRRSGLGLFLVLAVCVVLLVPVPVGGAEEGGVSVGRVVPVSGFGW